MSEQGLQSPFFEKIRTPSGLVISFFKCYHFTTPPTKEGVKVDMLTSLLSRLSDEKLEQTEKLIDDLLIVTDDEL